MMESEEKIPAVPGEPPQAGDGEPAGVRGRPWVKGQSGNPQGRPPSRTCKAAVVAQALLDRKTVRLVDGAIGWAEGGDKAMLRASLQRLVPPRSEMPVWLEVPPLESARDVIAAMKSVGDAVAQGRMTSAQGLRLVRLYKEIWTII